MVNAELQWVLQERDTGVDREALWDCRQEGAAAEGGLFEVCVLEWPWLVGDAGQGNLRRDRCITPSDGNLEPWMFAFRKLR